LFFQAANDSAAIASLPFPSYPSLLSNRKEKDNMNWEAAGAIGEIVGAFGVIASLLYVAMQVRASNKASAVQSKLATSRMHSDFIGSLIQNPDLDDILFAGISGDKNLAKKDYHRFSNMALQAFTFFSAGYFQLLTGTMDSDEWHETEAIIGFWLKGQGGREWWKSVGQNRFSSKFVAYIESKFLSD
jgi:hypothetical protein